MDPHGNYDIKIDNFAKAATMASAPPSRSLLPKRETNREQEAHGRIGIKVGNPANTIERAPLVRSSRFGALSNHWSGSRNDDQVWIVRPA
jgi:hypothetical protein